MCLYRHSNSKYRLNFFKAKNRSHAKWSDRNVVWKNKNKEE